MKKTSLLLAVFLSAVSFAFSQTSMLGIYPAATIATAGGNITVTPSSAPSGVTYIAVYTSTSFKGLLYANPSTGVVAITNAHPAGTYTITVKATSGTVADSATFTLSVGKPLCSQGRFVTSAIAINASASSQTYGTAVADVNNDGKQDFLVTASQTNTVIVRLGNGMGGFSTGSSVVVGTEPRTITTADFNGDGKIDVATANLPAHTVSVRLGDGAGNFSGSTTIPVGYFPIDIATGDFNGDGKKDIATANLNGNTVSVRLGDGAGDFSGNISISTGSNTCALAITDFDNDGKDDFVCVLSDGNVMAYRGDGSGNFTRSQLPFSIGNSASDIATGDFDGDGKTDIAVVDGLDRYIALLAGDGTGNFKKALAQITTPYAPSSVAVGDFNGDGKQDIAATHSNPFVSVFLNPGFPLPFYTVSSTLIATPNYTYGPSIGDFDADGRQDIVTSGSNYGNAIVLLGGANNIEVVGGAIVIPSGGDNYPFVHDFTDFGDVAGSRVTNFIIRNSGQSPLTVNNITVDGLDTVSFSIGKTAFPLVVAAGASTTFPVIFKAIRTGIKKAIVHVKSDNCDKPDYSFNIKASGIAPYVLIRYADTVRQVASTNQVVHIPLPAFNATNASVTASPGFTGLLSLNPITGLVSISNAQPAGTYKIVARFYNSTQTFSDSFVLVMQPSRCSSGNLYVRSTNMPVFIAPRAIATADFNNDNRPDLAIADSGNGTVQIVLATDTGRFTYGGTAYVWNDPRKMAIADINNDGYLDIVTTSYNSSILNFHRGNGLGSFLNGGASAWRTSIKPTAIALADLNKDGWMDMVVGSDNSLSGSPVTSTLQVYLGDRSSFGFSLPASNIEVAGDVSAIVIRDFTGDGYPDIATASSNRDVIAVRFNNGSGGFGTGTEFRSNFVLTDMAGGDFNKDGKADVMIANEYAKTIGIHLGTGTGTFFYGTSAYIYNAPVALAVTDLNGDGNQDWIAATPSTYNPFTILGDGTNQLFMSTNTFGPIYIDSGTMALTTGDWNADGLVDMATVSRVTNRVLIAYGRDNAVNVQGTNLNIVNNAAVPDSANLTYFPNTYTADSVTHRFVIQNTGAARLYVNSISLSGTNRSSFRLKGISQQTPVEAGDSLSFLVTFAPNDGGVKEAKVNISSVTCNNANYSFLIRGKAVCTNLSANNVWLGNTADWNTASNWSLGAVPNGCGKAVVNTGVPFMPQISTNAICYSLSLNNGATFTVTGNSRLTITGP